MVRFSFDLMQVDLCAQPGPDHGPLARRALMTVAIARPTPPSPSAEPWRLFRPLRPLEDAVLGRVREELDAVAVARTHKHVRMIRPTRGVFTRTGVSTTLRSRQKSGRRDAVARCQPC